MSLLRQRMAFCSMWALLKLCCALQRREGDAPSFFNAEEAVALLQLLKGLLTYTKGKGAVKQSDIGVICTYRRQVRAVQSSRLVSLLQPELAGHTLRIKHGTSLWHALMALAMLHMKPCQICRQTV